MTPHQQSVTNGRVQDKDAAHIEARLIHRVWGSDRQMAKEAPRRQWVRLESGKWMTRDPSERVQRIIDAQKVKAAAALLACLLLTACGKAYTKPTIEFIDRPAFIRIPANLTDCTYIAPAIVTNGDLARAYQAVSAALAACALDAEAVRRLQEGVK